MIYTYKWGFSTVDPKGVKNPSGLVNSGYENHPVINVTWYGAYEYCKWLSEKTGEKYSLPSEAQWEYAAGGGSSSRTKWAGTSSESSLGDYAWYDDNSETKTHEVGTKTKNTLGLHDMSGNVWEWCLDWYDSGYYSKSAEKDPVNTTVASNRVCRGGSWSDYSGYCRVAFRCSLTPSYSDLLIGFRVSKI